MAEEDFEPKESLPAVRYAPFSAGWLDVISPTKAKATLWHLDKLANKLIGGNLTLKMLNDWISEGSQVTFNYLVPRLTLATTIAYHTKRFRYSVYVQLFERRGRAINAQIELGALKNFINS